MLSRAEGGGDTVTGTVRTTASTGGGELGKAPDVPKELMGDPWPPKREPGREARTRRPPLGIPGP